MKFLFCLCIPFILSSCAIQDDDFPYADENAELEYLRDREAEEAFAKLQAEEKEARDKIKEDIREEVYQEVRDEVFREIDARTKGVVVIKGEGENSNTLTEYKDQAPTRYPVLKAIGYASVSLQDGRSEAEKVLKAIKSSKLDAYRELVEQLHGRDLMSSMTLSNGQQENHTIETVTNGVIRGAEVIKVYHEKDLYVTELELDLEKAQDLFIISTRPRVVDRIIQY